MITATRKAFAIASVLVACQIGVANAQLVSTSKTYDKNLRGQEVTALGSDLFGDAISLKDGTLQFSQTDVSIPTNSGLRVAFSRHTPRQPQGLDRAAMPLGFGWEIDVPYMVGTYDTRRGWDAKGSVARCSSPSIAPSEWIGPVPDFYTQIMPAYMYWGGVHINIPSQGYEDLLLLQPEHARPQDGVAYIGGTRSQWRIGCLPALKNAAGEGFVVRLPDGTKYYFDWMATRNARDVLASEYTRDANGDGTDPTRLLVPTSDVFIYATRVEDRHGNYVNYEFDPVSKHRLTSIQSNDGARIDVSYDGNGQVSEVRANGGVWKYSYGDANLGKRLTEVRLPDQSSWTFAGDPMLWYAVGPSFPSSFYDNSCAQVATGYRSQDPPNSYDVSTVVMKHPSGAQGQFVLRSLIHGSDNTPGTCGLFGGQGQVFWYGTTGIPNASMVKSLATKTISGPGISNYTWSYVYTPSWSFARNCSTGCFTATKVANPDGSELEYVFGNSYTDDYGYLYSTRLLRAGTAYRTETKTYATAPGPYLSTYGSIIHVHQNPLTTKVQPISSTSVVQDGRSFLMQVQSFDSLARPTSVLRSSTATSP